MTDPEFNIRAGLLNAIVATCEQTGLHAGPAADALQDAIIVELASKSNRWRLLAWVTELEADPYEGANALMGRITGRGRTLVDKDES